MNWFDLALAGFIVISVACGIREGFSRSGFGFLAVILAFLSAAWLYPESLTGFLFTLAALICAAVAGSFLLGKWLRRAGVKWLDRLLGGAFGLTNALLFSVFAVLGLLAFGPRLPKEYVVRSNFTPYAIEAANIVAEIVPDEMKFRVERSYEELARVLAPEFRKAVRPMPRNEN